MAGRASMLRRMTVRRAVATDCRATGLARAQVHPPRADLDALFADMMLRVAYGFDAADVRAAVTCHRALLPIDRGSSGGRGDAPGARRSISARRAVLPDEPSRQSRRSRYKLSDFHSSADSNGIARSLMPSCSSRRTTHQGEGTGPLTCGSAV